MRFNKANELKLTQVDKIIRFKVHVFFFLQMYVFELTIHGQRQNFNYFRTFNQLVKISNDY